MKPVCASSDHEKKVKVAMVQGAAGQLVSTYVRAGQKDSCRLIVEIQAMSVTGLEHRS